MENGFAFPIRYKHLYYSAFVLQPHWLRWILWSVLDCSPTQYLTFRYPGRLPVLSLNLLSSLVFSRLPERSRHSVWLMSNEPLSRNCRKIKWINVSNFIFLEKWTHYTEARKISTPQKMRYLINEKISALKSMGNTHK